MAEAFYSDYELNVKDGYSPTFGNVLHGLGDKEKARLPAKPREGVTVPIEEMLEPKEWEYFKALNSHINGSVHSSKIPLVDGKYKLILPDQQDLYKPDLIIDAFIKLDIIQREKEIVFQKQTDLSSPIGSNASSSTSSTGHPETPL